MDTKGATLTNHVIAHPQGLSSTGGVSKEGKPGVGEAGFRFRGWRAMKEAGEAMKQSYEHFYPIAVGVVAAGLLLLTSYKAPDAGFRLLAAFIGTSGLLYVWLAFDRSGYKQMLLNLATAVAVFFSALNGMDGNANWLVVGISIHALRGVLPLTCSFDRRPGLHLKEGWVAFNVALALALILIAI